MLAAHPSPQPWDGTPPALRNTVQGFVPQDRPDLQVVVLALVEPEPRIIPSKVKPHFWATRLEATLPGWMFSCIRLTRLRPNTYPTSSLTASEVYPRPACWSPNSW